MNKIILAIVLLLSMCAISSARPPARGGYRDGNYGRFQSYGNYYNGRGFQPGFSYNPRSGWYRQGYQNYRFGYTPVVPYYNYYSYPSYNYYYPYGYNWSYGW